MDFMKGADQYYLEINSTDPRRYDLIKLLERLIQIPDFNPGMDNNKAIIIASEFGRSDLVEKLLEDSRVDPSANHNDAIVRAATDGYLDVVKILMKDSRVDPSDRRNQALRGAITDHNAKEPWKEIVKTLLTDSRVEWRVVKSSKMIRTIYEEEFNKIKANFNISAREIIRESCDISKIGNIPSIRLVVLADMLKIRNNQ